MPTKISRRALLIAGGAAVVASGAGYLMVDSGVLPGRGALNQATGHCDVAVPRVDAVAGPVVDGEFDSTRRRRRVPYRLVYPPGSAPGDRLPVCLVLHGYGSDARGAIDAGRYDRHLAAAVAAGMPRFALAACDGGNGYWHPHSTDDPLGALLDEFVPLLASRGLAAGPADRMAALGWSMGGYGALLCGITAPGRFSIVVASEPAVWRSYSESHRANPTAFGSAAEWERYDVFSRAGLLSGLQVRIDCGESDAFAPAVTALRDVLPDPGGVHLAKGCHDTAFWQSVAPTQLRLIGETLNRT